MERLHNKVNDFFGDSVVLTLRTWQTIKFKHPEVGIFEKEVIETIQKPDIVTQSVYDERVHLYYKFYDDIFDGKYLVVVVKDVPNTGKFVSTVYVTDKRKGGKLLWQAK